MFMIHAQLGSLPQEPAKLWDFIKRPPPVRQACHMPACYNRTLPPWLLSDFGQGWPVEVQPCKRRGSFPLPYIVSHAQLGWGDSGPFPDAARFQYVCLLCSDPTFSLLSWISTFKLATEQYTVSPWPPFPALTPDKPTDFFSLWEFNVMPIAIQTA